jgi:hypothetical protein
LKTKGRLGRIHSKKDSVADGRELAENACEARGVN